MNTKLRKFMHFGDLAELAFAGAFFGALIVSCFSTSGIYYGALAGSIMTVIVFRFNK